MTELDDFLSMTLPRHITALEAMYRGDPTPWLEMCSRTDPVTVFGASGRSRSGWNEVSENLRWVASQFSGGTDIGFKPVAAGLSGDLAYLAGFEESSVSLAGGPVHPRTLRVTHVYRRENREWRMIHRHGDSPPDHEGASAEEPKE